MKGRRRPISLALSFFDTTLAISLDYTLATTIPTP